MLAPLVASVLQSVISSVVKGTSQEEFEEHEEDIWNKSLTLLHTLNNIEIINYFNNKPRFNGVFSRKNLPKIKDRAFVIHLDGKKSKGTHWVSLFIFLELNIFFMKY